LLSGASFMRKQDAARHVKTMNSGKMYKCRVWLVLFRKPFRGALTSPYTTAKKLIRAKIIAWFMRSVAWVTETVHLRHELITSTTLNGLRNY
jgi:hypothetical protein